MFFFSWFSGKSRQTKHASMPRGKLPSAGAQRGPLDDGSSKTKTHDSREQLYEAIREVMTHSGILSASYKFKVLDLDRRSSSYLVMIDLTSCKGDTVLQPAELETLIVQRAMVRYKIMVSAVYWRLNEMASVGKLSRPSTTAVFPPPTQLPNKKEFLQEPIQADEVAAFQRALLAASAHSSPASPEKNTKASSGLRRSAHLLDFEDTEVTQSFSYPVLSNTQYGDLH